MEIKKLEEALERSVLEGWQRSSGKENVSEWRFSVQQILQKQTFSLSDEKRLSFLKHASKFLCGKFKFYYLIVFSFF